MVREHLRRTALPDFVCGCRKCSKRIEKHGIHEAVCQHSRDNNTQRLQSPLAGLLQYILLLGTLQLMYMSRTVDLRLSQDSEVRS